MKTDRVLGPEECQGSAKFQSGAKLSPAFPRKSCPNHEMHVKCSPSFPRLGAYWRNGFRYYLVRAGSRHHKSGRSRGSGEEAF
jgi:hypothetical protein